VPPAEERASAKLPIVPREDDDLGGFLDDLEMNPGVPSEPLQPVAKAPADPPAKAEVRAAPPMLMPRMTPRPKRERPSKKPTVGRMSAIRPEDMAALKPAKVPKIQYDGDEREMTAGASARARAGRASERRADTAETKAPSAPPTTRKLASTKPPTDGSHTTKPTARPSARSSAPPTVRPIGAAVVNVRDEGIDEDWDE
jgi:hypothetical protein